MPSQTIYGSSGSVTLDTEANALTVLLRDALGSGKINSLTIATAIITALQLKVTTKSADFTVDGTSGIWFIDNSAGNVTAAMPAAASNQNAVHIFVVLSSAHNFVLDPNASEQVNGASTKTNGTAYSVAAIACDGTKWAGLLSGTWT